MFYTYILRSELNNPFYIGSTNNIEQRLYFHNHGLVKSTKRYKPWQLIYIEEYKTLKFARNRELQIKSWKSRKSIESVISKFEKIDDPR